MARVARDETLEELFKAIGGFPGAFALLAAAVLAFWRIKIPQISVEYLTRELETHRKEIAEADKDRADLRAEVQSFRWKLAHLDRDYLYCLADREKCRRHCRDLERQVRRLGEEPVAGEEDQD